MCNFYKKITLILLTGFIFIGNQIAQENHKKALLVIDVQKNLVDPNSRIHIDTAGIELFFCNMNHAISYFDKNAYDIIYIVNEWTNPFINWFTGNVCKKGAAGVQMDERLLVVNQMIYSKSQSNALTNADLDRYLATNKYKEIYLTGLMAEGCVQATAKGLIENHYKVVVIEDALGAKSAGNKTKALTKMKEMGVGVVESGKL